MLSSRESNDLSLINQSNRSIVADNNENWDWWANLTWYFLQSNIKTVKLYVHKLNSKTSRTRNESKNSTQIAVKNHNSHRLTKHILLINLTHIVRVCPVGRVLVLEEGEAGPAVHLSADVCTHHLRPLVPPPPRHLRRSVLLQSAHTEVVCNQHRSEFKSGVEEW